MSRSSRRPAWRSPRGTCSRCSSRIRQLSLNLLRELARACARRRATATLIVADRGQGRGLGVNQDEIVDALAGLEPVRRPGRPQLEAVAHTLTEESFPPGQRILRQGFAGTGFYVILEGEVRVRIDGEERARLGKGDFFGEMSLLLGEPPVADVVAVGPLRVLHLGGPEPAAVPAAPIPTVMYRMLQAVAAAWHRATAGLGGSAGPLARPGARIGRPFPPGDYPVVVVGSGPGGLQASYYLPRLGIDHAVISADPRPGGMFRRFPFFQRLLSWTKPYAPLAARPARVRALRLEQPARRGARAPGGHAGADGRHVRLPVAAGDGAEPRSFAERTGLRVRYGRRWESTSPRRRPLRAPHERRRLPLPGRRSSRSASPSRALPDTPGLRARRPLRRHAAGGDATPASACSSSASRTRASSWPPACSSGPADRARLAAPGEAVGQPPLAGRRPRALRPAVGGRRPGRRRVHPERVDRAHRAHRRRHHRPHPPVRHRASRSWSRSTRSSRRPASRARSATCRTRRERVRAQRPAVDDQRLRERRRCRASTSRARSARESPDCKKYGIPANSGAVHGAPLQRPADGPATSPSGISAAAWPRAGGRPGRRVVDYLLDEATNAPELWHQKSYLARAPARDADGAIRDEGIVSLADFVDGADRTGSRSPSRPTTAATSIPPSTSAGAGGSTRTPCSTASPLHDFRTAEHRASSRP